MPSASPESISGTMCGWLSRATMPISRRKRSAPTDADISACRTLIATRRSCLCSCARYTVAIPPRPWSRSIAYRSTSAALRREEGSRMFGEYGCPSHSTAGGRKTGSHLVTFCALVGFIPAERSHGRQMLTRLFDHLAWADAAAREALRTLPADSEEVVRARSLYAHLAGAEHVWLARLMERPGEF